MSAPQGGLILCQQTRPNVNSSYYLKKGEPVENVDLISPVSILPEDQSTTASIIVEGASDPAYKGAIQIAPGANSTIPAPQPDGITLRAVAGGVSVEVGTDTQAVNDLSIAGVNGLSKVYDIVYNPVNKIGPVAGVVGSIPANTGPGVFVFTPQRTGTYMLEVNFNIENTDIIANDGVIEYTLTQAGSEIQFCSNTLRSTQLSQAGQFNEVNGLPGTLDPPMDYSCSHLAILNADIATSFNLFVARASGAGGFPFSIANYQVRVIQMC